MLCMYGCVYVYISTLFNFSTILHTYKQINTHTQIHCVKRTLFVFSYTRPDTLYSLKNNIYIYIYIYIFKNIVKFDILITL